MKINKNFSLLITLSMLVLLAWAYQGPIKKYYEAKSLPRNFIGSLNFNKVDKISITGNSAKTELIKTGTDWQVAGGGKFFLDKQSTDQLIDMINKAKVSSLDIVSTKKERQEDFGLGKSAISVVMLAGNSKLLDFKIGRLSADYLSTYISVPEGHDTYKLQGVDLVSIFGKSEWRNLNIFNLTGKTATFLRLQYPEREFKLTPKGNVWMDGKNVYKDGSVRKIVDQLLTLTASSIPEQNFKIAGLDKPLVVAQLKGADFDKTLIVGKKSGNEYFSKMGDSDNIYLIPKSAVDMLIVRPKK